MIPPADFERMHPYTWSISINACRNAAILVEVGFPSFRGSSPTGNHMVYSATINEIESHYLLRARILRKKPLAIKIGMERSNHPPIIPASILQSPLEITLIFKMKVILVHCFSGALIGKVLFLLTEILVFMAYSIVSFDNCMYSIMPKAKFYWWFG